MASAVKLTSADNSSNLGRLRDQLFPYYIDQSEWVSRETLKGRHAVITFGMVIRGGMHDSFSMMGKCIVYAMPRGFLGPLTLNLAFPKGSPLRERFDQVIVRLRESGITGKIFSDRTINATDCIAPVSSMTVPSQRPLQLKDFYGMLLLFALGLLVATGVFLAEFAPYWLQIKGKVFLRLGSASKLKAATWKKIKNK
ncbi:uncharacterized protein LOC135110100 [Scylla paramamosain]|uniref:uncharacterized protein LOC135110100 n=1 Tax=Scylla paramamosain TaxID=85552 RepID=UPI003083A401